MKTLQLRLSMIAAGVMLSASVFAQVGPIDIDIAPQPLGQALNALARQSGAQIVFVSDITAGRTAPAVKGRLTVREALERLLQGANVKVQAADERTFALVREGDASSRESTLPAVHVGATHQADLPRAYAGGQVARGARLGMLGNVSTLDTPFNVTAYTSELIEHQQARSLGDVIVNDPAVLAGGPWYFDNFYIRGFSVHREEIGFDGLYGIASAEGNLLQGVERVEVLKGPSTLINGSAPRGAAGGAINLVPKRAGDTPLTRFTTTYVGDGNVGGHLDLGRRFGADNEFGVRINASHRDGDSAPDHEKQRASTFSAGLDYSGKRLRVSGDVGYSKQRINGATSNFFVTAAALPEAPSGRNNVWPAWSYQEKEHAFGALRADYDVNDNVTVGLAYGGSRSKRRMVSPFGELINTDGDVNFSGSGLAAETDTHSAEANMRLRFGTGAVKHQMVLAMTRFTSDINEVQPTIANSPPSNIYRPVVLPRPDDIDFNDPLKKASSKRMNSVAIADTLSMFNDRVLLTLGVRHQEMFVTSFNWATGDFESDYQRSETTPAVGAVFKVSDAVSVYGNYVEALSQGPTAPITAVNANEVFAPIVSKQGEVGVKVDWGRLTTSLSAFQIKKPSGFLDTSNYYRLAGEQRNRGLEFQVSGEAAAGVRVLGGVTWAQARLTRTPGGVFDGKDAAGAPEWVVKLGGEWDISRLPGLTATARMQHASSQAFNSANTVEAPSWTRFDLGARYATKIDGRPVVFRATVENVTDRRYWDTIPAFQVATYAAPRTVLLSAAIDF